MVPGFAGAAAWTAPAGELAARNSRGLSQDGQPHAAIEGALLEPEARRQQRKPCVLLQD